MHHMSRLRHNSSNTRGNGWYILLRLRFQYYFGGMEGRAVTVGGTGMIEENVTTSPHQVEGTRALCTPMFRLIITLTSLSSDGATKLWRQDKAIQCDLELTGKIEKYQHEERSRTTSELMNSGAENNTSKRYEPHILGDRLTSWPRLLAFWRQSLAAWVAPSVSWLMLLHSSYW